METTNINLLSKKSFFTYFLIINLFLYPNIVRSQIYDCGSDIISCGQTITLSNQNRVNDVDFNQCSLTLMEGKDLVYKFNRYSQTEENWITLWNYDNANLELFVYSECPFYASQQHECVGASYNTPLLCSSGNLNYESIVLRNMPPGEYWILIDAEKATTASSNIKLSLSCEGLDCTASPELECGINNGDNSGKYNSSSNYKDCFTNTGCFNPSNTTGGRGFQGSFTAGEDIWHFTPATSGDYTFILKPTQNIDLEFFLITDCCDGYINDGGYYLLENAEDCYTMNNCIGGSTNAGGSSEIITLHINTGETVYLIVDGFLGAEGPYTISVSCPSDFHCDNAIPIDCGEAHYNSNYAGTNNLQNYCSVSSGLSGNEVVYSITPQQTKEYEIYLANLTSETDFDMFLFVDCVENVCLASSDGNNSSVLDQISVTLQAGSTYYLVVDGDNNGGQTNVSGEFILNINCHPYCENDPIYCNIPTHSNNYEFSSGIILNQNPSFVSHYNCNGGRSYNLSGPEKTFNFTPETTGDYTFELNNTANGQDLDIFILEECNPHSCIANSDGPSSTSNDRITVSLVAGKKYIVVVDGEDGSESTFTLIVNGCPNECSEGNCCEHQNAFFCETFENYTPNTIISDYTNWTSDDSSPIIRKDNSNTYLLLENNNFTESALLSLNDNTGNNETVTLTFDVYLLPGEGFQTLIYDQNSNNIYLGIVDGNQDGNSEIRIDAPKNFFIDYQDFDFIYNDYNRFEIILNKANQKLTIKINGIILTSIPNSGFLAFEDFYVDNQLTTNSVRIDNICLAKCGECEDEYNHIVDEFYNCDLINLYDVVLLENGNSTMKFSSNYINENEGDTGWEIHELIENGETQLVLSNSQGIFYDTGYEEQGYHEFIPTRKYIVCYYWVDESGCRNYCCIKIEITTECYLTVPYYIGGDEELKFQYEFTGSGEVEGWYNESGNIGNAVTSSEITYTSPSTYTVCCLVYNELTQCYILCCQDYCVEDPIYDCDNVIIDYIPLDEKYLLSVENASSVIQWDIDYPSAFAGTISTSNTVLFDPKEHGIPNNTEIIISCKYIDPFGCVKVCCKRLCIINYDNAECSDWYYEEGETGMIFNINNDISITESEGISWYIEDDLVQQSTSSQYIGSILKYPGETVHVCCVYYDHNNCLIRCCREVPKPGATEAVIFQAGEECGSTGSSVLIPITIRNFKNISSFSFELGFSQSQVAKFKSIKNISSELQGFTSAFYNLQDEEAIIGWSHPFGSTATISLADNHKLFDIEIELQANFQSDVLILGSSLSVFGDGNRNSSFINGKLCKLNSLIISGTISRSNGSPLENVEVFIENGSNSSTQSDGQGFFEEKSLPDGYTIVYPSKNNQLKDGVSIVDVALIRRHALKKKLITDDYGLVAADVYKDGVINFIDVGFAQSIYLETMKKLSGNTSWRYIPKSYDISSDPLDLSIPEQVEFNPLLKTEQNVDFIGVKVADVNNININAKVSNIVSSRAPLSLGMEDISVVGGSYVTIPINISDFNAVSILGFEITWDSTFMRLENITDVALPDFAESNFSIHADKLIIGWDEPNAESISLSKDILLNMDFLVNEEAMESTSLNFTNIECLDDNFNIIEVQSKDATVELSTSSVNSEEVAELNIYPNPFENQVHIKFKGNYSEDIFIEIFQSDGKEVFEKKYNLGSEDEVTIEGGIFSFSGVYFLKITGENFNVTQRIVRLE